MLAFPVAISPPVAPDDSRKAVTLRSESGRLELRLDLSKGCVLDHLAVFEKEVLDPAQGVWSGVKVGERWYTTATLSHPPSVTKKAGRLEISGIDYGGGRVRVSETWTLTARADAIEWKIDRHYLDAGTLDDTAMPQASFASMSTWTGALLGTGGVAWGKLLDAPNATYGVHTGSATLWNPRSDACLRFAATDREGSAKALRFTREPGGGFSMVSAVTREPLRPRVTKSRFLRGRKDVWAPFAVSASQEVSATYELKALSYRQAYGRGDFKGFDTGAITELLNTIGRIGVIDEGLVGSNGWYSGYICMHEPWLARVGTAIDDPNYRRTSAEFLDFAREHAIAPDGMVKSRWKYDEGDAQPGTYDEASGFYEAQWGRLMDAQSSYVTNVADQFDASGDKAWVRRQKGACEAALDYLLRRDADRDGLVEMANSSTSQRRSSDWLDIVWASHENAFVNAQLYGALQKWSAIESLLGDSTKASAYHLSAARLKRSFNRPIAEGGFWDPSKGWYAYWRDADGSVHGDNLTVPINLTALSEGLCDDPQRRRTLLDGIETRMKAESLLAWPACFQSYAPGEGANDGFPTYENGDIFLAWAEYGVRAYAATEPQVALKYVRRIVDQYKRDGLAYQRYLRKNGKGAGDDILANNANVITGLYRDIYGIQPKHNRLVLDPHLVPELNGTRVDYDLRGTNLEIGLSVGDYRVRSDRVTVRSSHPFGLAPQGNRLTFFPGTDDDPALTLQASWADSALVSFADWKAQKRWTIDCGSKSSLVAHTFHGLRPGTRYVVAQSGKPIGTVSTAKPSIKILCKAGKPAQLQLIALP